MLVLFADCLEGQNSLLDTGELWLRSARKRKVRHAHCSVLFTRVIGPEARIGATCSAAEKVMVQV
jgi:hypothetical protein